MRFPKALRDAFGSGVDLFFVISGFVLAHNLKSRASTPGEFLRNRVARVVPLYWLLTLAAFAVATVAPTAMGGTQATFSALLKSLFFIPFERADQTMRPILFVGWSLNLEALFYLLFAAGLLLRNRAARLGMVVTAIVGLVLLGVLAGPDLLPEMRFFTRPIILEFALGMLLASVYPRIPASPALCRAALVAAPLCAIALVASEPVFGGTWPVAAIPATVLVATALVLERGGLVTRSPTILLLGSASYSLYLSHPFVAQAVNKLALYCGLMSPATIVPIIFLIYLVSCIVAVVMFRYVELPLSRGARRALGVAGQSSLGARSGFGPALARQRP